MAYGVTRMATRYRRRTNPGINSKLPDMELAVRHLHGNRLLPLVELKRVA
jgi:hypothetical protein